VELSKVHNEYLESKKKFLENENSLFCEVNLEEGNFFLRDAIQIKEINDKLIEEIREIDNKYEKLRDNLTYTETPASFDPQKFMLIEKEKRERISKKNVPKKTVKKRQIKDNEDDDQEDEDSSWEKTTPKKRKTKK
jgi:hypothetical protein